MAGYAAVKLGYKQLGFLGGMAVPAVVQLRLWLVQGVNAAATELKTSLIRSPLSTFTATSLLPAPEITAVMDTWYKGRHRVVFCLRRGHLCIRS